MSTVIEGGNIENFQFLARMKALHLESVGMKRTGRTAYSICKELYGYRGNKKNVLKQMEADWEHFKETGEARWSN